MSLLNSIQSLGGSFGAGSVDQMASQYAGKALDQLKDNGVDVSDLKSKSMSALDRVEELKNGFVEELQGRMNVDASSQSVFSGISNERAPAVGDMVKGLIDEVDAKKKASASAVQDLMTGRSDNVHQAMISMQESSVAFNLLLEVRNKLMDSYKELSKMSV